VKRDAKLKLVGWIGIVDGRPFVLSGRESLGVFDHIVIYKTLKDARHRFEETARVWMWGAPRKGRKK
jgi:hypothetical protein